MYVNYTSHGGRHQVSVVHCPTICDNRLVHLSQDGPQSWVLRDFISGQMIRNTPAPNSATSALTLAQIEAEVTNCEAPWFHSVQYVADWSHYLQGRTMTILGSRPGTTPPNPQFGTWQPI